MTSNGKPSEVFLLCHTDVVGGRTEIICAYSSMPLATKEMFRLAQKGEHKDVGYYVTSVELKQ